VRKPPFLDLAKRYRRLVIPKTRSVRSWPRQDSCRQRHGLALFNVERTRRWSWPQLGRARTSRFIDALEGEKRSVH